MTGNELLSLFCLTVQDGGIIMPDRDLGGLGETKVEEWALQKGIVPNRVHHDKKGWDIFLQFPQAENANGTSYTLDIRPPEISCLVQVKSTDKKTGRINHIKLTNWERMAKSPLPCFFAVIEYDGNEDPQRAYIVHMGEYWIGKTLEKLREHEAQPGKLLHRCSMQLTYSDADMIDIPNGASLENAIRKHVGDDPQEYFRKKSEWIKNVGYDECRAKVHFTLPKMSYASIMETLVDFGIGVIKEINLNSLSVEDVRFGIPHPLHTDIEPVNPKITVSEVPPAGEADVVITGEGGSILFQDSFTYYSPGNLFPFIPFEYMKLRFSSEIMSFILSMKDNRVNMNLNLFQSDNRIRISKLSKAANFIKHSAISENVTFKIEITTSKGTLELNIHSSDFPPINDQLNKILSIIETAGAVFSGFDQFADIEVTPTELMNQSIPLMMMKGFLDEEQVAHISSIIDSKEDIDLTSLAFVNCLYAAFGRKVFVLSGYILGQGKINAENEGFRVTIENGMGRCIKKRLMSMNTFKKFSMNNFANESFKVLDEQGVQSVIIVEGQPRPSALGISS